MSGKVINLDEHRVLTGMLGLLVDTIDTIERADSRAERISLARCAMAYLLLAQPDRDSIIDALPEDVRGLIAQMEAP